VSGAAAGCIGIISDDPNAFDPETFCTVNPEALSCYREPTRTCACEDDCPVPEASCHPAPDCPAEVLAAYPTAKCIQLTRADIGPFQSESDQCLCGCEDCLLTCDGRGPLWTQLDVIDPDTGMNLTPSGVLTLDVQRHLPDTGRAGMFVRSRGVTAATSMNPNPLPPDILGISESVADPFVIGALPILMSDRFEERLYPAAEPLSWSTRSDMPTLFAFSNTLGAFSLYEIDCVIPFIVE